MLATQPKNLAGVLVFLKRRLLNALGAGSVRGRSGEGFDQALTTGPACHTMKQQSQARFKAEDIAWDNQVCGLPRLAHAIQALRTSILQSSTRREQRFLL